MKIYLESLGCPKNLTDTEVVMGLLASAGHQIVINKKQADIIILNTCAFLASAEKEAQQRAKSLAKTKKPLIIIGCLPQRRKNKVKNMIPQAVAYIGSSEIYKITDVIARFIARGNPQVLTSPHGSCLFDHNFPRIKATPSYTAYVKIAEGCNNLCSYCVVPSIRGKLKSRPISSVVKEINSLVQKGVKEIIFVAQDSTSFGKDLGIKNALAKLCRAAAGIKGVKWIRIMYAHPAHLSEDLIKTMAKHPKICSYLDLPIQHASDKILRLMNRPYTAKYLEGLITRIRRSLHNIALRSTVIVGFPGETKQDFAELYNFIKETKFERLGIFAYSREEGTPASKMRGQVTNKTKLQRLKKLQGLQRQISRELNKKLIGKKLEILIEKTDKTLAIGRSYMDAPDIDGRIVIFNKNLAPGQIAKARVTNARAYDLVTKLVT